MPCKPPKPPAPGSRARYVLPGPNPGLREPGNIDLWTRPSVRNPQEGGFSSVFSMSFGNDDGEVVIPRVVRIGGKWVIASENRAITVYYNTGKHLGIFDNFRHANRYTDRLHLQQARIYCNRNG